MDVPRTATELGRASIAAHIAQNFPQAASPVTTQPDPVHHLLDRLLRGVILPEEAEQLAALVRAREERLALLENGARERSALLEEARDALEAAGINEAHGGESWPRLVPAIEELAADNARLTAGQCIDSRAMCEQHHAPPVAGCPYPRCRAARGDQPTPAPRTPGVIDLPDINNA